MTPNSFHAMSKPKNWNWGWRNVNSIFSEACGLTKSIKAPLPSNGGTGRRLNVQRIRFSEKQMLANDAKKLPFDVNDETTWEKFILSGCSK